MKVDDRHDVAVQYATETNLEAPKSLYADATGPGEATVPGYIASLGSDPGDLPRLELPLRSPRASSIFVAEKA